MDMGRLALALVLGLLCTAAAAPIASKPNIVLFLTDDQDQMLGASFPRNAPGGATPMPRTRPVLRLFPPCALVSHAQGSSGVVDNMLFAWRGHTKSLATRARPSPDLAVWLE